MGRLIDGAALAEEFWAIRGRLQMMDDTHTADKMMRGLRMAEEKLESATIIEPYTINEDGRLWIAVDDIDLVKSVIVERGQWIKSFYDLPKAGRWIYDGPRFKDGQEWMHCSECGYRDIAYARKRFRFCPNCGSEITRWEIELKGE